MFGSEGSVCFWGMTCLRLDRPYSKSKRNRCWRGCRCWRWRWYRCRCGCWGRRWRWRWYRCRCGCWGRPSAVFVRDPHRKLRRLGYPISVKNPVGRNSDDPARRGLTIIVYCVVQEARIGARAEYKGDQLVCIFAFPRVPYYHPTSDLRLAVGIFWERWGDTHRDTKCLPFPHRRRLDTCQAHLRQLLSIHAVVRLKGESGKR